MGQEAVVKIVVSDAAHRTRLRVHHNDLHGPMGGLSGPGPGWQCGHQTLTRSQGAVPWSARLVGPPQRRQVRRP